jgi:ERCC4-type nuclease
MANSRVVIHIDNRERELKAMSLAQMSETVDSDKGTQNKCVFFNLEYGDVLITVDDATTPRHPPLVVIERKTIADLAASIKDGRYKNQKLKLKEKCSAGTVYYIIEGCFHWLMADDHGILLHGISQKALMSAIINTMVRDNIKVIITRNVEETFACVEAIYRRIRDDPSKYFGLGLDVDMNKEVEGEKVLRARKDSSLTREKCFENQLCQVPDMSAKTAKAVVGEFKTMEGFYKIMVCLSDSDKIAKIKSIMILDDKGKGRRISERVAKNIVEFMF